MAASLGSLNFRLWVGQPPEAIKQTVQVLEHPGVDYEAYRWIGKRSGSFERSSRADFDTEANARTAFASYVAAIETGPHQLVFNDLDFDGENVRVIVETVRIVYLRQDVLICGATTDGNTWDMECRWRMRLTPI